MRAFKIVASGDFREPDGSPAYPGFDFTPLSQHPAIAFEFLEPTARVSAEQIGDADVLVLSGARVTEESFHANRRLGLITQFGAGFDHIDLAAATANAVAVTNTPTGVRRPMAVAIMALVLALVTRLPAKSDLARKGHEGWAAAARMPGTGLTGRTLASIGLGNIASDLFQVMRPLAMRFIAFDPFANPGLARELGVELVSLDAVFAEADILTVNCPLTENTRHLVDAAHLALMKPTAYLVNTSRGPVVDQQALITALEAKHIAGDALDVFEEEPLPPSSPLVRLDNVLLTPHSLCWSDELYAGCGREVVDAALDFIAGRAPRSVINREVAANPEWLARLARNASSFDASSPQDTGGLERPLGVRT